MTQVEQYTFRQSVRLHVANLIALWESRANDFFHWYSIVNTLLILAIIEAGIYMLFFESAWLTYANSPFPITDAQGNILPTNPPPKVKAGDVVPLWVNRCSTLTSKTLYPVGHELRPVADPTLPPVVLRTEFPLIRPGCEASVSKINAVPAGTRAGVYRIDGFGQVNLAMRTVLVPWESRAFEVVD